MEGSVSCGTQVQPQHSVVDFDDLDPDSEISKSVSKLQGFSAQTLFDHPLGVPRR